MTDPARGHSAATLVEAAGAPIDLDPEIRAAWPGARLVGRAFTVQGTGGDNLALHLAVTRAESGDVLVVDAGAAPHGHWGEVLTVAAQARGIAGLLIDGGVRDSAEMAALGFSVFSRRNAIRGTRKDFPGIFGRTVRVGGVLISPGDLIVGDADGVVAIPSAQVARVLDHADERVAQEQRHFERLRAGERTIDLYEFGAPYRQEV
ncbi:RraA family protein [Agromyces bracchium]|uniref:Putative 4-hydroxy-4-methyl-2-oxoglutarate aldolase n=1 Tax=Agromyces bracchium TaxID=88376 RepID=A0A6I3MFA8_9MICO|nr:RraA family protein [Agromyces bracchium]MTH70026.1 dimethylmenaquinone methyltransferase [Agromyces bracchium]